MMKIDHKIIIERAVEEVFCFLSAVENQSQWQKNTIEATLSPAGFMSVGSIITVVTQDKDQKVEKQLEVTEYRQNRKISWKTTGNNGTIGSWTFDTVGQDKTMLQETYERSGLLMTLAQPFIGKMITKDTKSNHIALKKLLEV